MCSTRFWPSGTDVKTRRSRINRVLSRPSKAVANADARRHHTDAPRRLGPTLIDFSRLPFAPPLRRALADAFWSHERARAEASLRGYWHSVKAFGRFAQETKAIRGLSDVNSVMLVRYLEWINRQVGPDGTPWHVTTRASAYSGVKTLLRWLQRCRPELLGAIDFPRRVFRLRHAALRRSGLSPQVLRAILRACEKEIADLRALRAQGAEEMALARATRSAKIRTRGEVLLYIEERHGGVAPPALTFRRKRHRVRTASDAHGGYRAIEPCLYPRAESIFPYYLAIIIHAAGNPQAIAQLDIDCLQPIPLLDDRELLVWSKGRANKLQRRSFRTTDPFEPPALVRELVQWTERLRPRIAPAYRNRLFIAKGHLGIHPLSWTLIKKARQHFVARHHLPPFALSAIRPGVLTAFYRLSGDLRQAKEIANHAHLSTTVSYVQGPEVDSQNQVRVAALQGAFLGHIEERLPTARASVRSVAEPAADRPVPRREAVSMFGFDCKDPLAGIAPGTRAGELCTHYLGCFTCPNAVITAEPAALARLLQARDHLRSGSTYLHPARWEAIYAPQLRILEEDILTRFSARELSAAGSLCATLPSLPQLR
jgi:hypothetical protein